jgi:hypothetical protein
MVKFYILTLILVSTFVRPMDVGPSWLCGTFDPFEGYPDEVFDMDDEEVGTCSKSLCIEDQTFEEYGEVDVSSMSTKRSRVEPPLVGFCTHVGCDARYTGIQAKSNLVKHVRAKHLAEKKTLKCKLEYVGTEKSLGI